MLWHLNQFQWMELPGIGYFFADKINAKINLESSTISPSKLLLHYDHRAHQKTEELVEHLHTETGYEKESIEQALANLVYYLGNELKVRNEIIFEPFGKLYYTKGNNVLQFQPSNTNLHINFFGQEDYPLNPLKIDKNESTSPTLLKPSSQVEKRIKPSHNRLLLTLLALLWLLFLGLLLCPAKKNNKSNNDSNLPKIDSPLVTSNSNDTSTHQVLNELDSNQLNPKDTSSSYQHEEKITSSKIDELNEKIEKKKCVIIVGSFKKSWNAKRQLLRIKKLGYSSYSEKFGEFQRTGVEFDCDHDQLNHMLEELKTKFAADSWILKY